MKRIGLAVFSLCICLTAAGDFRIWKDKKGNSVKAEFVSITAGKVIIRDQKGKVYRFEPTRLSARDQEYLKTAIPPEVEIVFSKRQDRRNKDYSYSAEVYMSGTIELTKKNRDPYIKEMKAVFMMVGEDQRTRSYIMLDRVESAFDFKDSGSFELNGNQFRMYEDKYDNSSGTEYVGFVAVVLDDKGALLEVKSSRKDFEENVVKLLELKTGERFTKKFSKVTSVRSY